MTGARTSLRLVPECEYWDVSIAVLSFIVRGFGARAKLSSLFTREYLKKLDTKYRTFCNNSISLWTYFIFLTLLVATLLGMLGNRVKQREK